jgi:hypothetical protein
MSLKPGIGLGFRHHRQDLQGLFGHIVEYPNISINGYCETWMDEAMAMHLTHRLLDLKRGKGSTILKKGRRPDLAAEQGRRNAEPVRELSR